MVYSVAVYIIFSLCQIRNKARQMMSTPANTRTTSQQSTGARSKPDLIAQVLAWRAQLRSKKYLKDPCKEDVCHVSLTSEELDHPCWKLRSLQKTCARNILTRLS